MVNRRLHLLVGVFDDRAVGQPFIADGQAQRQLAALGFVEPGGLHLLAHGVPLRFGEGPLNAKQQAVGKDGGIIHAIAVADQNLIVGGEVEQLIPVGAVAGEARDIGDQDQADFAQADIGVEPLEAIAFAAADGRFAQVFIDDHNLGGRPPQLHCTILQLILQILRFEMLAHLFERRLANIDIDVAAQMACADFGLVIHAAPPAVVMAALGGVPVATAVAARSPAVRSVGGGALGAVVTRRQVTAASLRLAAAVVAGRLTWACSLAGCVSCRVCTTLASCNKPARYRPAAAGGVASAAAHASVQLWGMLTWPTSPAAMTHRRSPLTFISPNTATHAP